MHKLIILFCLIASGCSNYIHTTHANIDGNMVRQNELLEDLAKDKTKLDKYLNYSKSIYPKIENLPSSDDVKNKIWSPPKIINMSSALYETNALGQEVKFSLQHLFLSMVKSLFL